MDSAKLFLLQKFSKKLKNEKIIEISDKMAETDELVKKIQSDLNNKSKVLFKDWRGSERHYFFLSNYYYIPFRDKNDKKWGTSEAYFQAQKYLHTDHLTSDNDKKNYLDFANILRKEFKDGPDFVKKLSGSGGGRFFQVAFKGIDQENKQYKNKDEKEEKLIEYKNRGQELNKIYKNANAPKTTKLKPINLELWTSEKKEDIDKQGNRIFAMIEALVYKFQNKLLIKRLLETENKFLIENNSKDSYWAIGSGDGKNMLGKLLVILRNIIREYPEMKPEDQVIKMVEMTRKVLLKKSKKKADTSSCMDYLSVINDSISFGKYPGFPNDPKTSIECLESNGFNVFVDLTNKGDNMKTHDVVQKYTTNGKYYSFPIIDRKTPELKTFHAFIKKIISELEEDDKIYVHCRGGHGRAAVFTASFLVIKNGYSADKALKTVYEAHQKRNIMPDRWRSLGAPQTKKQKDFVREIAEYSE